MTPKWQKLASLAQEICTLWFQFFGAVFAAKGYPFKNIFENLHFLLPPLSLHLYTGCRLDQNFSKSILDFTKSKSTKLSRI